VWFGKKDQSFIFNGVVVKDVELGSIFPISQIAQEIYMLQSKLAKDNLYSPTLDKTLYYYENMYTPPKSSDGSINFANNRDHPHVLLKIKMLEIIRDEQNGNLDIMPIIQRTIDSNYRKKKSNKSKTKRKPVKKCKCKK
jgi:hypothetical protein